MFWMKLFLIWLMLMVGFSELLMLCRMLVCSMWYLLVRVLIIIFE